MKCLALVLVLIFCLNEEGVLSTKTTTTRPTTTTKKPPPPKPSCGYESCNPTKKGFINVHIVPHSHDDVGWLKTVDQYYYGSKSYFQKASVLDILDSVIAELKKDDKRRFIYVETAYFWKWWMQQHDFVRHNVKNLVNSGRLEFISGGWSMNDEAATNYQSIIDQMTWGLRKLNDTFGKCGAPRVGWQIDPFGHSKEMASIFAQLGFDGLLLGRIDYQDKNFRFTTKTAEMVWEASDNLGNATDLFTSVMYNTYSPPPGFCFDILCNDEPLIDDKKSPMYNIPERLASFFEYLNNVSRTYATSNIIITMGEDFNYQDARVWYNNLDKLIYYANLQQQFGSNYNLLYSTPSCYLKAVHNESTKHSVAWPVKSDDFFPYASDPDAFWTGYFTSRPTIKRFERQGNNFLQVCKQLAVLADLDPIDGTDINVLREAMGVMQHHDAITGTEKEHVAHDYARILSIGFDECEFASAVSLSKLATNGLWAKGITEEGDPQPALTFNNCLLTNVSSCSHTEVLDTFLVTVYNPLSRPVSKYIRFPVTGTAYTVTDPDGKVIPTQLVPIPAFVFNIPGRNSSATVELTFLAENLSPLGYKAYHVTKKAGDEVIEGVTLQEGVGVKVNAWDVHVTIDGDTGLLASITMNNKTIPIKQELLYYRGTVGDNRSFLNRSSGAYIFRPNGTETYQLTSKAQIKLFQGDLIVELHQVFNEWAAQIIRVYKTESLVEFDWVVGPIPVNDVNGKEVISRFTTNLKTDSAFYTDSNGREMLKRIRNFRPTWKLNLIEQISGNYYPVTSKIVIRDETEDVELAVLTDRAQGGSSLRDGEIELMVHRSCLHDDSFGVGEALNEQAFDNGLVVRGSHYLLLGGFRKSPLAAQERDLAQRKLLEAWTFISPIQNYSFQDIKSHLRLQYSGLVSSLPKNVQILTLEPWIGASVLLRLEHVLEKGEDPSLSQPAIIDLQGLFTPFEVVSIKETTLGANRLLNETNRLNFKKGASLEDFVMEQGDEMKSWLKWKIYQNDLHRSRFLRSPASEDQYKISLNPMQIRTFIIETKKKGNVLDQ